MSDPEEVLDPPPDVVLLFDPRAADPRLTGGKAAPLARLGAAGFPVPEGFVVTAPALTRVLQALGPTPTEAQARAASLDGPLRAAIARAYATLGGRVAVRSSGLAEDLEGASFAGQYETVLDVEGEAQVADAVLRCLASALSARVRGYQAERGIAAAPMAVLVQRMLAPRTAGVAFTVHPITGERDVVVLSAVGGVGEALVSGTADAEEWEVRGEHASRRRMTTPLLTEDDARRVAGLARRVAAGAPTDVEWALDGDTVRLLQARPMTAVPEPVRWEAPCPGAWVRNFRFGEWIGAPVTPLFETWLLEGLERGMHGRFDALFGTRSPEPLHVVVNGWYFYGMNLPTGFWMWLRVMVIALFNLPRHWAEMCSLAPPLRRFGIVRETRRWREVLLPRWREAVVEAEANVDLTAVAALPALIDGLVDLAAIQAASIVAVSGHAAMLEMDLARFGRRHLAALEVTPFDLICGAEVAPAAHDVEGLDWCFPTLGEQGPLPAPLSNEARAKLLARRDAFEQRAREHLSPKGRAVFTALVAKARAAHAVRQDQTGQLTLAWPVLRRAVLRLGAALVERRVLASADEVFFLQRAELDAALRGEASAPTVAERRALWERRRRLTPPLLVGELRGLYRRVFAEAAQALHHEEHDAEDALRGMPGSPGRVTGPARVVRGVDELDRLRSGEILVCPVTTPGWTPGFARALAIVTDTGSVASHASIVAREHGIPAVVGTGDGTARIVDGQRITVDGGRGVVRLRG